MRHTDNERDAPATDRGTDGVRYIVAPGMWAGDHEPPEALYNDLDALVRPDLAHHYAIPLCARRWLEVCRDPAYGHDTVVAAARAALPHVLEVLDRAAVPGPVPVVSLGPGDGSVDEPVLRGLDAAQKLGSWCGIDSSFVLLRRAASRLATANGFRRRFPITAVCADFTQLDPALLGNGASAGARLFLLLGLTLGNYRESSLLTGLRRLMRPGDLLLLDARLHALGPDPIPAAQDPAYRAALIGHYDLESQKRFVFGPVEMATTATHRDVQFHYEPHRRVTSTPGALNVTMFCTDLRTTMRRNHAAIERQRLDLGITTLYDRASLAAWLSASGDALTWQGVSGDIGLFLMRIT